MWPLQTSTSPQDAEEPVETSRRSAGNVPVQGRCESPLLGPCSPRPVPACPQTQLWWAVTVSHPGSGRVSPLAPLSRPRLPFLPVTGSDNLASYLPLASCWQGEKESPGRTVELTRSSVPQRARPQDAHPRNGAAHDGSFSLTTFTPTDSAVVPLPPRSPERLLSGT